MSYSKILSKAIDNSKLSLREISNRCKNLGVPITHSYISQLKTGKQTAPSEEITIVLSKVLDIKPDLLIIESYLDNAPDIIINFLEDMRFILNSNKLLESNPYDVNNKIKEFRKELADKPISEFILSQKSENVLKNAVAVIRYNVEYYNGILVDDLVKEMDKNPDAPIADIIDSIKTLSILDYLPTLNDDSMSPTFPNGTKFIVEDNNYSEGDIVAFIDLKTGKQLIRKYAFQDELVIFTTINHNYPPLIYKKSEVKILGKTSKAIVCL